MGLVACGASQPTATTAPTSEPLVIEENTSSAAVAATPAITLTFEGDECVYHGPDSIPAGSFKVVLDASDQTAHGAYGVIVATLDEGKTAEDLLLPSSFDTGIPLWVHRHVQFVAEKGTVAERRTTLFEGPLYLSCWVGADINNMDKAGVQGPIEIETLATSAGKE
jgi:hypothetical protein